MIHVTDSAKEEFGESFRVGFLEAKRKGVGFFQVWIFWLALGKNARKLCWPSSNKKMSLFFVKKSCGYYSIIC